MVPNTTTHDYTSFAPIFYYFNVGIIGVGATAWKPVMEYAQSSLDWVFICTRTYFHHALSFPQFVI